MKPLQIYRKRLIPQECILLKGDEIVRQDDEVIVTKWNTLKPGKDFTHGCSCYYLKLGIKVSKFYRADNSLLYWYCDIVDFDFNEEENSVTVTDLLADVVIYPDGNYRVVDLPELAEAYEKQLITASQMTACLRRVDNLLFTIYRNEFDKLQSPLAEL